MAQDPAGKLYTESPFAHGYMHGYQEGFHYGDFDLQLQHRPQDMKSIKGYRSADHYYKSPFGNKGSFKEGYQAGFRIGYMDAFLGSDFRAVLNLRQLSQDLPEINAQQGQIVDQALSQGYKDGVKIGLEDGRASSDYRPDGSDCDLSLRFKPPPAPFYCTTYALGYRLGYSDGFHNQHPQPVERHVAGEQ